MSIPNVDTFEHDISEEIKNKEASIADIAAASGNVGNTEQTRGGSNLFFILGGLFIFVIICVLGALLYFTARNSSTPPEVATSTLPTTSTSLLYSLSPTLSDALSGSVSDVKKGEYGYTLSLSSYTGAFAYMVKNENAYADELALAFGEPRDTSTSSSPFIFTDITLNNHTMRVGTSGSSTIAYAFINAQALVIASSTQGILSLASDILQ
jgi:hypothetical protein